MGSSKVESVMSDCFILASIIWVRALHIPLGQRMYEDVGEMQDREQLLTKGEAQRAPEEA